MALCCLTLAHRFRCAAAIFLQAAESVRLLPFWVGVEFAPDNSRRTHADALLFIVDQYVVNRLTVRVLSLGR